MDWISRLQNDIIKLKKKHEKYFAYVEIKCTWLGLLKCIAIYFLTCYLNIVHKSKTFIDIILTNRPIAVNNITGTREHEHLQRSHALGKIVASIYRK